MRRNQLSVFLLQSGGNGNPVAQLRLLLRDGGYPIRAFPCQCGQMFPKFSFPGGISGCRIRRISQIDGGIRKRKLRVENMYGSLCFQICRLIMTRLQRLHPAGQNILAAGGCLCRPALPAPGTVRQTFPCGNIHNGDFLSAVPDLQFVMEGYIGVFGSVGLPTLRYIHQALQIDLVRNVYILVLHFNSSAQLQICRRNRIQNFRRLCVRVCINAGAAAVGGKMIAPENGLGPNGKRYDELASAKARCAPRMHLFRNVIGGIIKAADLYCLCRDLCLHTAGHVLPVAPGIAAQIIGGKNPHGAIRISVERTPDKIPHLCTRP